MPYEPNQVVNEQLKGKVCYLGLEKAGDYVIYLRRSFFGVSASKRPCAVSLS